MVYLTSRNLTQPRAESLVTYLPTDQFQDVESYHWKEFPVCDFGSHSFYISFIVGNDIGAPLKHIFSHTFIFLFNFLADFELGCKDQMQESDLAT